MANAFGYGRNALGRNLAGRQECIDHVLEVIGNRGRMFMTGPRRIGKSAILDAALLELSRIPASAVRIDAELFPTFESMAREIILQTVALVGEDLAETDKQIRRYFAGLHPVLEYGTSANGLGWNVAINSMRAIGLPVLLKAIEGLELFAQSRNTPVAMIIDEFQRVLELGGSTSEAQIRSLVQQHHGLGYIFAGSDVVEFTAMCTSYSRPFYRSGSLVFVGPVPRTDFIPFLIERFRASGVRASDQAVDRILDRSRDVPYNVQMLALACCSRLAHVPRMQGNPALLTEEIVDETLENLVRGLDCFYAMIWNGLTSIQQQTLLAVIENEGINLQSTAISQRIGHGPATIRQSLQSAVAKGILLPISPRAGHRISFVDPFQEVWISQFILRRKEHKGN